MEENKEETDKQTAKKNEDMADSMVDDILKNIENPAPEGEAKVEETTEAAVDAMADDDLEIKIDLPGAEDDKVEAPAEEPKTDEAPVEEQKVEEVAEAPAETPAEATEAPIEEPASEAPSEEVPAEAPVEDAKEEVVSEAPVEETPAPAPAEVAEAPVSEESVSEKEAVNNIMDDLDLGDEKDDSAENSLDDNSVDDLDIEIDIPTAPSEESAPEVATEAPSDVSQDVAESSEEISKEVLGDLESDVDLDLKEVDELTQDNSEQIDIPEPSEEEVTEVDPFEIGKEEGEQEVAKEEASEDIKCVEGVFNDDDQKAETREEEGFHEVDLKDDDDTEPLKVSEHQEIDDSNIEKVDGPSMHNKKEKRVMMDVTIDDVMEMVSIDLENSSKFKDADVEVPEKKDVATKQKGMILNKLADISKSIDEKTATLVSHINQMTKEGDIIRDKNQRLLEVAERQEKLFEKLAEKFGDVPAFKEALEDVKQNKKDILTIKGGMDRAREYSQDMVSILQFGDLYRQKIQKVILLINNSVNYLTTIFSFGQIDFNALQDTTTKNFSDEEDEEPEVLTNDDVETIMKELGKVK